MTRGMTSRLHASLYDCVRRFGFGKSVRLLDDLNGYYFNVKQEPRNRRREGWLVSANAALRSLQAASNDGSQSRRPKLTLSFW